MSDNDGIILISLQVRGARIAALAPVQGSRQRSQANPPKRGSLQRSRPARQPRQVFKAAKQRPGLAVGCR